MFGGGNTGRKLHSCHLYSTSSISIDHTVIFTLSDSPTNDHYYSANLFDNYDSKHTFVQIYSFW